MAQAAVVLREKRRRLEQQKQQRARAQQLMDENLSEDGTPGRIFDHDHHYRMDPRHGGGPPLGGPQGKWPQRGPRLEQVEENHANFRKKNKVTLKEGIDENGHVTISEEDIDKLEGEDGVYQASGSANVILYVGLGMICIGLVITFVGLGDKGFRTLELKLIGPSLVGCGVFFALLRILFCTVPSCCRACFKCCRKGEDKEELIEDNEGEAKPKSALVMSNNTNVSFHESRRIAPSDPASMRSSTRSATNNYPKTGSKVISDDDDDDDDEEFDSDGEGEFRRKTLRTAKQGGSDGAKHSSGGSGAKPISYDNYSTDTSSQFSVDIVEVAARSLDANGAKVASSGSRHYPDFSNVPHLPNLRSKQPLPQQTGNEVVLNASRLEVESETA